MRFGELLFYLLLLAIDWFAIIASATGVYLGMRGDYQSAMIAFGASTLALWGFQFLPPPEDDPFPDDDELAGV